MEIIIAELFYGNITPSERCFHRTGEYAHILQLVTRNEDKLTEAQAQHDKSLHNLTMKMGYTKEYPFAQLHRIKK